MADILLIEDDHTMGMSLELSLSGVGHDVRWRDSLAGANEAVAERAPGIVLLDLGLPDGDGLEWCRSFRAAGNFMPILIVTARVTLQARVEGLRVGADDYLTKPFELAELLARVEALLRRQDWHKPGDHIRIGNLDVDFQRREASVEGQEVELTDLELKLLRYLLDHVDQPVSRGDLLSRVWGLAATTRTRTVDVFISRLRRHIEPVAAKPRFLVNVRGVGYRLRLEPHPLSAEE